MFFKNNIYIEPRFVICIPIYDLRVLNMNFLESDAEEEIDDCACQKCGQKDHPEWILLCDSCDSGWHCSCLRPALLVIPEGDWFCPPCQHVGFLLTISIYLIILVL